MDQIYKTHKNGIKLELILLETILPNLLNNLPL